MATYQVITNTTEYRDALFQLQADIQQYLAVSGRRSTTVYLPKSLTDLIVKRGKSSYELVVKDVTTSLSQFYEIGDWSMGVDEKGKNYIRFRLFPERARDGD